MNLLTQYNQLMLNNLKCHTNHYYSQNPLTAAVPATMTMQVAVLDPANNTDHRKCFYQQVISSMIQKKIKNHTMLESWQTLELQREKFEGTKTDNSKVIDGPTLAWVILTYVKPSSNAGINKEVKMIKAATMTHYNHNPIKLMEEMELN
eukprot:11462977-Ditylum_brightwellii.AAC.2